MAQEISLAQIERRAWTSYFDDGLFDIFLGLVLLIEGASGLLLDALPSRLWGYGVYAVLVGLAGLAVWAAKRFITMPRLGRVVFGPARKARRKKTAVVLAIQMVVGMVVLGMLAAAMGHLPLVGVVFARSTLLALAVGVWVMIGVSLIAYFMDFDRGYLIALFYGLGFGGTELLNNPVMLLLAAAATLLVGLVVLARFLRQHRALAQVPSLGDVSDDE